MTWALMLIAARSGRKGGQGGLGRDISTRFMGLIVLAMGVQFALAGYQDFMSIG
jgi:multiple antibiotic resistance protein